MALPVLQGSQKLMQLSMGRLFSMLVERMDASVQGEAQPRMLLYSGHDTWVRSACMTLIDSAHAQGCNCAAPGTMLLGCLFSWALHRVRPVLARGSSTLRQVPLRCVLLDPGNKRWSRGDLQQACCSSCHVGRNAAQMVKAL